MREWSIDASVGSGAWGDGWVGMWAQAVPPSYSAYVGQEMGKAESVLKVGTGSVLVCSV